jgi:hypothetical protein
MMLSSAYIKKSCGCRILLFITAALGNFDERFFIIFLKEPDSFV